MSHASPSRLPIAILALVGPLAAAGAAMGQQGSAQHERAIGDTRFRFAGSGFHMFETDIDGGGDFSLTGVSARIDTDIVLDRDLKLDLRLDGEWLSFDFSQMTGIGPNPWNDVYTVTAGAALKYDLSTDWSVFGGPIFQASLESEAKVSSSLMYGGVGGVTFISSERLVVGGGLGVITQLDDDARVFPVFILNWQITDSLALRSSAVNTGLGIGGLELVWDIPGHWELGFGGAYEWRHFRLDNSGIAPEGVGQLEAIPIWARLGYNVNESLSFDFRVGLLASGEVEIKNDDGNKVGDNDFDDGIFISANFSWRF